MSEFWSEVRGLFPIFLCFCLAYFLLTALGDNKASEKKAYDSGYKQGSYDGYWKAQAEHGIY